MLEQCLSDMEVGFGQVRFIEVQFKVRVQDRVVIANKVQPLVVLK